MAESLVELILLAPEEEQGKLLAATIAHLGNAFPEKSGPVCAIFPSNAGHFLP
jgi:hypothetical protein